MTLPTLYLSVPLALLTFASAASAVVVVFVVLGQPWLHLAVALLPVAIDRLQTWSTTTRPAVHRRWVSVPPPIGPMLGLLELHGREDGLGHLRACLSATQEGRGSAVFITGALGVGKTALLSAICESATALGARVLRGRAWPLDAGLAYAPLVEALGAGLRDLEAGERAEIVASLPDLGHLLPWLPGPAPTDSEAGLTRTRLFEAVAIVIQRLAARSPVVLAVDDLHLADAATVELLQYLVRRCRHHPVLVLLSHRVGAAASRTLRLLGSLLERAELATTIALEPLSHDALQALVEARLGGGLASPALLQLLFERARGVPLFATALLTQLRLNARLSRIGDTWYVAPGTDDGIPLELGPLLEELIDGLPSAQRVVADVLAAGGEPLSHPVLVAASGAADAAVLEALTALTDAGHVVERRDETQVTYHLAHPLTEETLYQRLGEVARRRLHRALLDAFQAREVRAPARLARHYRGVGVDGADAADALPAFLEAAAQAKFSGAHRDEARWLGAAVRAVKAFPAMASLSGPAPLLERLGAAWSRAGEHVVAAEVWSEALAIYRAIGDQAAGGRLRVLLMVESWHAGRRDESARHLTEGMAELEPAGPSEALAELYIEGLRIGTRGGDIEGVRDLSSRLLTPEFRAALPDLEAAVLLALFTVHVMRGELEPAWAAVARAREIAVTPATLARVLEVSAGCHYSVAEHAQLEAHAAALDALAVDHGPSRRHPMAALLRAGAAHLGGRFDDALRLCQSSIADGLGRGRARFAVVAHALRAEILAMRGEFAEADEALAEARAAWMGEADRNMGAPLHVAAALCALATEDLQAALRAVDEVPDAAHRILPRSIRAEVLALNGEYEAALVLSAEVAAYGAPWAIGHAQRAVGIVHELRGDKLASFDALSRSLAAFESLAVPFEAERIRLRRAGLRTRERDEDLADAHKSLAVFEALGAAPYVQQARTLLKVLGVQLPRALPKRVGGLLTARELEVAQLGARGLTNAAIARRLFLSPHTVAAHFKHIYARVEVSSRDELARFLADHNLGDAGST